MALGFAIAVIYITVYGVEMYLDSRYRLSWFRSTQPTGLKISAVECR